MAKIITDKEKVRKRALKEGRKVLWYHPGYGWRAATNRANTPGFATETEDVTATEDKS